MLEVVTQMTWSKQSRISQSVETEDRRDQQATSTLVTPMPRHDRTVYGRKEKERDPLGSTSGIRANWRLNS